MYWLFFCSLLLLASLFGLKSYEISNGQLLFAEGMRRKIDRTLERLLITVVHTLKEAFHRIRKVLVRVTGRIGDRISRTLRKLADHLEGDRR